MFFAALCILAVSVWFVPLVERARLPLLAGIVLLVGTIFGPAFFSIQGPLLISFDRVLFSVVCVVAFFSLRGATASIPKWTATDGIVFAYVIWVLVSALRGDPPAKTSPLGTWIFYILMPALTYFVVRVARLKDMDLRRIETLFIGLSVYLAVTAVLESRGFYAFVFPRFIADPEHWEFFGRGRGPLLNPSANGIVMTIGLATAAVRFLRAERSGKKMFYAIMNFVMIAGLYSTLTRSVWIGAILALAIVFWNVTPRWVKVLSLASAILVGGMLVSGLKDQLLRMKKGQKP